MRDGRKGRWCMFCMFGKPLPNKNPVIVVGRNGTVQCMVHGKVTERRGCRTFERMPPVEWRGDYNDLFAQGRQLQKEIRKKAKLAREKMA